MNQRATLNLIRQQQRLPHMKRNVTSKRERIPEVSGHWCVLSPESWSDLQNMPAQN